MAVDNNYAIWGAFYNNYWPADYFVDAQGQIRAHAFGEGDYDKSEHLIQTLLTQAGVALLPTHSNAMRFRLLARDGQVICERDYFSVGGGFVTSGNEPAASRAAAARLPFTTAAELLDLCRRNGLTIAEVQAENELDLRDRCKIDCRQHDEDECCWRKGTSC